jgi:flagellar assembly factor FliW
MLATFSETTAMSGPAMITVQTQMRGPLEVPANRILRFTAPVLGFDHLERFLIYQTQSGPLHWLQSVEDPLISFCLLAPFQTGMDIDMEIGPADAVDIGAVTAEEIDVYTVLVLDKDPDQIRTNLRAPLLVCARTGLAKQLVLSNAKLPIQFRLKDLRLPPAPKA